MGLNDSPIASVWLEPMLLAMRQRLKPLTLPRLLGLAPICLCLLSAEAAPPRAAVFSDELPGFDHALASEITAQVQAAGYTTELINTATLTNTSALTNARYDLLVLPGARSLPMTTEPAIVNYLKGGGALLALGLPAWESPVFQIKGQWLSRQAYDATLAATKPQHTVESFAQADLARWSRAVGDATGKARYELADGPGGKSLHAVVAHLGGWDTLSAPTLAHPFPAGHTLTCFRAKGGPHTRQLALEWREENGSRWIATVDLTPEWQSYALTPEAFKAWPTWPAESTPKGHFQPERAAGFAVGLAMSHTALEGEEHEYWFAELGTAASPFGDAAAPEQTEVPALESLCPSYQCFPIRTPVVVRADHQACAPEGPLASPDGQRGSLRQLTPQAGLVGLHPRPRGVGFNQGRPFRWEPLLGAYDATNQDYRGALAALVVNLDAPFRGSVWAAFTPTNAAFYREPVVTNCLRQTLSRMKRGVFLTEGGTEFFTVFAGQQFKAGASVVNFGRETVSNLSLAVSFLNAKGIPQRTVLEGRFRLAPGETQVLEQDGLSRSADEVGVATTLALGRAPVDGLRHELGVWQPKAKPQFIEARDGGFWLAGKPWKAHGVNYMPSSGIGLAHMRLFEGWLNRGAYDPEVIERDLRRVKAMNLNAVSIFVYHQAPASQHLLDFLRRCEVLGLHVNQALRPGTPMNFRWPLMKELIEFYRLAENDTVFAYDLAWEPSHGSYQEQQHAYAKPWQDWVLKRYGTVAGAEKAWGVAAPLSEPNPQSALRIPQLAVPSMAQLTSVGPWHKLVADYRLFLDQQLGEHYAAARKLVKSIDPHHAVSFRMSNTGDPGYNWDNALAYDFYGLADAVDIWAPEAYGRIGDWDRVKLGAFTAAYARLCDPAKPLMWAEVGYTVWDGNRMAPDPHKFDFEAHYFADFYRMMMGSGANGVFFWWYPGGFRRGEDSDFGIINPDGTDRPVTATIRTLGPRFLEAPQPAKPDCWLAVNRDRDPRGLYGIYEAVKDEYWQAIAQDRRPGLKWEQAPGTAKSPSP